MKTNQVLKDLNPISNDVRTAILNAYRQGEKDIDDQLEKILNESRKRQWSDEETMYNIRKWHNGRKETI